jgi:hypothetical protein
MPTLPEMLAFLRQKPVRPPIVVIGGSADGALWQPVSLSQARPTSLAPAPGLSRHTWTMVGQQAPRYSLSASLKQLQTTLTERHKAWLFAHANQYRQYLK